MTYGKRRVRPAKSFSRKQDRRLHFSVLFHERFRGSRKYHIVAMKQKCVTKITRENNSVINILERKKCKKKVMYVQDSDAMNNGKMLITINFLPVCEEIEGLCVGFMRRHKLFQQINLVASADGALHVTTQPWLVHAQHLRNDSVSWRITALFWRIMAYHGVSWRIINHKGYLFRKREKGWGERSVKRRRPGERWRTS